MPHVFRQSPAVIEGIGDGFNEALRHAGVLTLAEMLRLTPERVERQVPSASLRQVDAWFAAARLLRVEGIEPDLAEAFVGAGIDNVNSLAGAGLQSLERAVANAVERKTLRGAPSLYKLAEIQRAASRLRSTGSLYGNVVSHSTGDPVAGVELSSSRHATETADDGYFELHGIDSGYASVTIASGVRRATIHRLFMRTDEVRGPVKFRIAEGAPVRSSAPVSEKDGAFVSPGRGTTFRIVTRTLEEMPNDTYFRVRAIGGDAIARLLHLYRTRVGREILGDRVDIDVAQLPKGAEVGHVLHYRDGKFQWTPLTLRDIARRKLEATFGPVTLSTRSRTDPKIGPI